MRTVKFFWGIIFIVLPLGWLACGGKSVYIAPDSVTKFDDKFSDTDMRMMAEEMVRSMILHPRIAGVQNPPIVAVVGISNSTSEHINTEDITDKIRIVLLKTGRVRFVDRAIIQASAKEMALNLSGAIDPSQAKQLGKMVAADLLLRGEITSINKVQAHKSLTFYRLSLHLTDLETNEMIWADEKEIKKLSKKGFEDW